MAGLSYWYMLVMLCDLTLYATFAGSIAVAFGANPSLLFLGILLHSICYGISAALKNKGVLRYSALLLMLIGWFLPGQVALDRVVLCPTAAYIIWRVVNGRYELSHDQQAEHLFNFCKVFWLFALLFSMISQSMVAIGTMFFFAGVMVVDSVLLLRFLRHGLDEKMTLRLFTVEITPPVLLLLFVIGLLAVCGSLVGIAAFLYSGFVDIAAFGIGTAVYLPANLFVAVMQWLLDYSNQDMLDIVQRMFATNPELPQITSTPESFSVSALLLTVLIFALGIIAIILLFWRLAQKLPQERISATAEAERSIPVTKRAHKNLVPDPSIYFVRRQYRRFLKACKEENLPLFPADTSEEINLRAEKELMRSNETSLQEMKGTAQQLRTIYLCARYNGKVSRADAAEAKRLTDRLLRDIRAHNQNDYKKQ